MDSPPPATRAWHFEARPGRALLVAGILGLLLAGCSPLNQGAVTLDEASGRPMLVLNFCPGEGAAAVRLAEAVFEGDAYYEEGRILWRIETASPRPVATVVAGMVPDGFREVVPLASDLPGDLVMTAENAAGPGEGVAAEQGSGLFSLDELVPGVLLQNGDRRSAEGLRRDTETNCSSSFFGPLALGLPGWLEGVISGAVLGVFALVVVVAARQRNRDARAPRRAQRS